jgi:UDP-glucose 4-epimerase
MKQQRILVTGGAGFIGSHTVDLLLCADKQVVVLDNLSSGRMAYLPLNHPNLELIEGDVLDYHLLSELIQDSEAVLHLAAIASVPASIEQPIYTLQVNTQGVLHVLEAIRQAKQPIRLVFASSAAVYGDASALPCSDEMPIHAKPLSPYALQKAQAEQYAALYAHLYGIPSLALRYFNVYGLRQDPASPYSGVISRFLSAYQSDQPLTIFGDGKQSRDFIAVSDIARANCLALESETAGALNIASGEPQSLLQLAAALELAGKRPAKLEFAPARTGDIRASYASVNLAKQQLGFTASISLQEGIKELLVS